ncbi:MAG: guanylate kinase [Gammaproteobacteria bacterium]|jgi:guanylate kinase|nr:guanylate kinase [Gammaproteobacteria bacterium]
MSAADSPPTNTPQPKTGTLFVLSAPSGAGKTTLVRALMARDPELRFSVSFTTRKPRPGEVPERDYFFVDEARFEAMVAGGEFLEHARVFSNLYGTSKAQVEAILATGRNVLLEIDWQGAQQIRKNAPHCCSIFIMPPSTVELERRLRNRATDSEEVIRQRLSQALDDMAHWQEFDYVVINADQQQASEELQAIIQGRGQHLSARLPARAAAARAILGG